MNDTPTQVDINEAIEYATALKHCHDCFADRAAILLYDELAAVTEQRDRLAEALRKIKPNCAIRGSVGDYRQGQLDIMDIMAEIAQEALQSLTTNAKSAATGSERNENE
jgi:hypothetical protein